MAERDLPPGMADQLNLGDWSGAITFANRPLLTDPDQLRRWEADVAVVGAPLDWNVTHRPGCRFGPRALRASAYNPGTYHLDHGIEIFENLEVVDFGDAYCPHGRTEESFANISERVGQIVDAGALPITIGGDHSVTNPVVTALAERYGAGRIGMIHFDAHADTGSDMEGNLASHGAPMRRLIESGAVRGDSFIQVGLRGYWPPADDFEWMQGQQMRWHLMHEVWERGSVAVITDAIAEATEHCDALYLSVDVDVLDPGFAPGTGTPEPGGMAPVDLLRAVRQIVMDTPLVGMDVVEVSPPYDWADQTVNNAHRLIFEALASLAVRRRDNRWPTLFGQ